MSHPVDSRLPDRKEWGPKVWNILRWFAIGLGPVIPPDLQQEAKAFYRSLMFMLPCHECRDHYTGLWTQYPIDQYLTGSEKLLEWIAVIHDQVTKRIKQQQASSPAEPTGSVPKSGLANATPRVRRRTVVARQAPVSPAVQKRGGLAKFEQARARSLQNRKIRQGVSGTPAAQTTAKNTAHARALARLAQSAKNYSRPCSC